MASTRSVSVELLGNSPVGTLGGTTGAGNNPATVGLGDGSFVTAIDDSSANGLYVQFSNAVGAKTNAWSFGGEDPSIARLTTTSVAVVETLSDGQIKVGRVTADSYLGDLVVGTGRNADIATSGNSGGYGVVWERSDVDGKIGLAIAASDSATSVTQLVVPSSETEFAHDPSVARLANGNYVVAWAGKYEAADIDWIRYAVFKPNGDVVTPATFIDGSGVPAGSESGRFVHPSVAVYGDDFTVSFEDYEAGQSSIAQYTRDDDGKNIAYRHYESPAGLQNIDPDTATVGRLHLTAFTSNAMEGDVIRVQDLNLGISEVGTGTVLTDLDNLAHIADDGSQASVSDLYGDGSGRFVVSYYDGFGGEVRQQLARVRETITGDASNQTLSGKYYVAVTIDGGGGGDVLSDGKGDDKLLGNTGNDTLYAAADNEFGRVPSRDTFDGGIGTDTLSFAGWGLASATANLSLTGPQDTGGGMDTIVGIENLVGCEEGADKLTGSNGANVLDDGGTSFLGAIKDTLNGGLGSDTYVISDSIDVVIESSASGGTDLVKSHASGFVLPTNVENLTLLADAGDAAGTGNGLANALTGNNGINTLDGKGAADTMSGLAGSDTYLVDTAADRVVEAAGGGTDRLFAGVSYVLAAGQQVETLATTSSSGTGAINLTGNETVQTLFGNAGANGLDGKGGADTLQGLSGNDTYYVDNASDKVVEAAGGGTDRLFASVSYVLAAGQEVETLATTSSAGTGAINLTGNEKVQTIFGNAGANRLDGKAGADTLSGLSGNDIYTVDNAGDRVVEAAGGGTDDRVVASVSYTLGVGQQVEVLGTTSSAGTGSINLTGNELAQAVIGNAGANRLDGKAGGDTLSGLGGKDVFLFTTALNANDHIADFVVADDTMQLSRIVFAALPAGSLSSGAFKDLGVSGASVDSSDRILYNHNTGVLTYDADGSGTGSAAVRFAILDNHAILTFQDFTVV